MTQALSTVPYRPSLFTRDGEVFATSESVAADFDKNHKDVLRAIDGLSCSKDFRERNFALTLETRRLGAVDRSFRSFEMTRDGFAFLAMGFTGETAGAFKEAYLREFNRMRDELQRRPAAPVIDLNDPSFLRQALLGYTEKVIALEATVAVQKKEIAVAAPKAAAWEAYKDSEGLYALSDVGRILGTGPQKTIDWMVSRGLLFRMGRGSPLRPMERFARKGWFVAKSRVIDGVERVQTFATPRGLAEVAELMGQPLDLFGQIDRSRQAQLLPN